MDTIEGNKEPNYSYEEMREKLESNSTTKNRTPEEIMYGNCVNYANFHIQTMGMAIVTRGTEEVQYKPLCFQEMSIPERRKLLEGKNINYILVKKSNLKKK